MNKEKDYNEEVYFIDTETITENEMQQGDIYDGNDE